MLNYISLRIEQPTAIALSILVLAATSCSTANKCNCGRATATRHSTQNLVQYARPICGTGNYPAYGGDNNTFPGAVAPFGMIQWSPDTGAGTKPGGYAYYDTQNSGFSLDHLSGAGCGDGGNFSFMPILDGPGLPPNGNRMAFAEESSHDNETQPFGGSDVCAVEIRSESRNLDFYL